jgi:hypothetical protein
MKKITLLTLSAFLAGGAAFGQDKLMKSQKAKPEAEFKKVYFGIGLGMDYGGIGFKAEFVPFKYVGIFAGAGYNIARVGVNAGVSVKAFPDSRLTPTAIGMYGYNAVIVVAGDADRTKIYYGPTIGIGGELKVGRRHNKLYVAVLRPFRNDEFETDYEAVKNDPSIDMKQSINPVTFSFGFNFAL